MSDDTTAPSPGTGAVIVAVPETGSGLRLAAGQVVADRYRVRALLGRGGMGEVYRVTDFELGIDVALKTLPVGAGDADAEALRREIRHGRQVAHRNVCRMFDLGSDGALDFVTMELLAGETLADRLTRGGRLDAAAAFPLLAQIADGLAALHDAGVVHRDLKPGNVILDGDRAVVTDFGLARGAGSVTTRSGTIAAGTPAYMAPEQLHGERATARTDVYAFAILAYEVLTGRLPFLGDSPAATALVRLTRDPTPVADDLPASWDAAFARALARDPAARPASPLDVVAALSAPATQRARRWWPVGIAALAVAAGGAVTWRAVATDDAAARPWSVLASGGPGADNFDAVATIGDDVIVAGKLSPGGRIGGVAVQVGAGGARVGVVARLGRDGSVRWVRELVGDEDIKVNALAVSPDGAIALAGFATTELRTGDVVLPAPAGLHDGFVIVIDGTTGAVRWARATRSTGLAAFRALAFDAGGSLYGTGELQGETRVGALAADAPGPSGSRSLFVAAWDPEGAARWMVAGIGSSNARAFALATDGDEVIAGGMLMGDTQLGDHRLAAAAHGDAYVIRIDAASGAVRSARLLQGTGTLSIHAIAPVGDGRVVIAGDLRGEIELGPGQRLAVGDGYYHDGFVAALDADGTTSWVQQLAGSGEERVLALGVDGDRIVVAGHHGEGATFGDRSLACQGRVDVFHAELGLDGVTRQVGSIGGPGYDVGRALAIAPDGTAFVAGRFELTLEHDGEVKTSRGLTDALVVKIPPLLR